MKIEANEFVLPFRDGFDCHASHFMTLGENEIFCVYFYGSKEGADDVSIFGSHRSSDGKWSEPQRITEDDGIPHWNPVLERLDNGRVILFYKVGKTIADWVTYAKISCDNCKTFGEAFELVAGDSSGGRGPVRNKVIRLKSGRMLAPGSTERGEWKCFIDRSDDGGNTWTRSEDISLSEEILIKYKSKNRKGIIQPTLWESAVGVHALMRSTEGSVFRSDSYDGGVSWCEPYSINMPNNNSGIDLVSLPDGRIILAANPVSDNWGARTPISLFVSHDNGMSFELLSHLTTMQGEYSYPAMRYENGHLHITYTWNRKTVQYFCLSNI